MLPVMGTRGTGVHAGRGSWRSGPIGTARSPFPTERHLRDTTLRLGSSAFGFRARQPLGYFVERLAIGEKLHHAFRLGRSEFRNFLLDCRRDRPVPDRKESQDSLLQAAFLPARCSPRFSPRCSPIWINSFPATVSSNSGSSPKSIISISFLVLSLNRCTSQLTNISEEDYAVYHPSWVNLLDGGHLDHRPPVYRIVRLELELDNR